MIGDIDLHPPRLGLLLHNLTETDVVIDNELIYSKYDTGRFPDREEVTKLIQAKD